MHLHLDCTTVGVDILLSQCSVLATGASVSKQNRETVECFVTGFRIWKTTSEVLMQANVLSLSFVG